MIIGLTGLAGSGKDTVADVLQAHHRFAKVLLADPVKRICQDVFGWSYERLWGPSQNRNEPDPDWDGLTARHALQTLGTEWGRAMHPDVWARRAIREAKTILANGQVIGVVIPDVRFHNEEAALHAAGGKLVRIFRPSAGLPGVAGQHPSEVDIPQLKADFVFDNSRSLEDLKNYALKLPELLFG